MSRGFKPHLSRITICAVLLSALGCSQNGDSQLEQHFEYQKAIKERIERNADDWKPPAGPDLVYTTDWVSPFEERWRDELSHLKNQSNVRILEIGSFEGRSANWFLDNIATHPSSSVTCVDPFGPRLEQFFYHNIRVGGNAERVVKLKGKSQDVLRDLDLKERFDFIYVDGCHLPACAITDITLSWDLLKLGGVLIIDDYGWDEPPLLDRPELAVDSFLQIFEPYIEVRHKGHQVIVRKTSSPW